MFFPFETYLDIGREENKPEIGAQSQAYIPPVYIRQVKLNEQESLSTATSVC